MSRQSLELVASVALHCLFDVDADTASGDQNLALLGTRYLDGLFRPATLMFPHEVPGSPFSRFLRAADALHAALGAMVRDRIARVDGGRPGTDILSLFIAARFDDGSRLSEADLIGQAAEMFVASYETTAHTIAWTVVLLSQHPRLQDNIAEELAAGAGEDSGLLDRVIKESQRLLPATPFLFFRRASQEAEVGGHRLPVGSTVILSPFITHRLPECFTRPTSFVPSRWENLAPTPYEYLPFGTGARSCVGATFAAQTLRITLGEILRYHRVELASPTPIAYRVRGITFGPKGPLMIRLRPAGQRATPVPMTGPLATLVS